MAYLYLTENYKRKHNNSDMEYYHEKLRTSEDPTSFLEEFDQTEMWKMRVKHKDSHRLILQRVTFQIKGKNYDVFCAKHLLPRGSKEYRYWDKFVKKWKEKDAIEGKKRKEVEQWLKAQLRKEWEDKQLQFLPPDLEVFTHPIPTLHLPSANVYESQEWIEAIKEIVEEIKKMGETKKAKKPVIEAELKEFYKGLCSFVREVHDNDANSEIKPTFEVIEQNGVFVLARKDANFLLYACFQFPNTTQKKPFKITFLFDLYFDEQKGRKAIETIHQQYPYNQATDNERLLRDCKRTYEDFVLYDSKLWQKIQENEKANLALSIEERTMLQNPTFPMFINGQAGSGKSTVLYYLFAHFYAIEYQNPHPTPNCLFFTYNEELLGRAQKNIRAILQHNGKYIENPVNVSQIKNSFYTLHDFIRKYLLPEKAKNLFIEDKYMSFSKFKRCYLGKFHENKYNCTLPNKFNHSPDLVWHIIRTYIKGHKLNENFSVEDYKKLKSRERSVSDEEYQEVWEITQKWYNKFHENGDFWDDQDLIRYVLQNVRNLPRSPVLFCDEVQDFTRIELDLLWQLSSFTKYDLTGRTNIPFAFAGDPNQTVHPTGFQWYNLVELFEERFKTLNLNDLNINIRQLHHNYRSKSAIIQFSNLIQKFRYTFLGIAELRPQISWQKIQGVSPCLFILHQDVEMEDLERILAQSMILIPTSRSEEEYIRKNRLLKHIVPPPRKEGVNEKSHQSAEKREILNGSISKAEPNDDSFNVMSVASAKGLEFDKVVLYNFGDHVPKSFQKCVSREALDDNEKIELIHFFSKLYVAVSRASHFLFIIDTQKGYEKFWKHFMEKDLLYFEEDKHWKDTHTVLLAKGTEADLHNITENNPQKIAQTLQQSGKAKKDYTLLSRAKQYYQSFHNQAEALDCAAWANWFKEDWTEAGKSFAQLGHFENASESFWKAQKWQLLKELHEGENSPHPHLLIAKYMLKEVDFIELLDNAYFNEYASPNSESWKAVLKQLQKDFENITIGEKSFIDFKDYAYYAEKIGKKGFPVFFDLAGSLYFKDAVFDKAVKCWDENHNPYDEDSYSVKRPNYHPSNYFNAKIKLTKNINKKALWYHQLKEYEALIDIYKEASSKESQRFKTTSYNFIFDAFIKRKLFDDALIFPNISLRKKTKKLLEKIEYLGPQAKTDERKKRLFDLLLKKDKEGAQILVSHIESFKRCFEEKNVVRKILQNEGWKSILEAHQKNFKKTRIFNKLLSDLLVYLKIQNWSADSLQNSALHEKFEYGLLLLSKSNQADYKRKQLEKIFRILLDNPLGIELIHNQMDLFRPLFKDKKTLKHLLGKNNWSELLKEYEEEFQKGLSTEYVDIFVELVCYHLRNGRNTHLIHTVGLIEQLTESDKLTMYVKLINAASESSLHTSTKVLSDTLKEHLISLG